MQIKENLGRTKAHVLTLVATPSFLPTLDSSPKSSPTSTFVSLKQQHAFFEKVMLHMARQGHDEEDGFEFVKTITPQGVDVFEREVPWSQAKQLRTRAEIDCTVKQLWRQKKGYRRQFNAKFKKAAGSATAMEKMVTRVWCLHEFEGPKGNRGQIRYRHVPLPWPLSDRDFAFVYVYLLNEERDHLVSYSYDLVFPGNVPHRNGCVRG